MKRVLLVEDSNTIRHILKVYLMRLKLDFLEAEKADHGLRLLITQPVDLVIADFNLPGSMDGVELVRRIRASEFTRVRQVPIVLLTGGKAPDLEAKALQAGASEFVRKPISIDALAAVARRHRRSPRRTRSGFEPGEPVPGRLSALRTRRQAFAHDTPRLTALRSPDAYLSGQFVEGSGWVGERGRGAFG
ncbi:response regulator [Cystobacter fuscus]